MQCVGSSNSGPHHYQIQSHMFITSKASDSQKPKQCFLTRCIPVITMVHTTYNCTRMKLSQSTSATEVTRSLIHSPVALPLYWLFCSRTNPFSRRTGGRPWPVRSRRHSGWRQAHRESRASIVSSPHPRRSNSSILLTGAPHLDRAVKRGALRHMTWS